jgi:sugar/nucleoside kinase (ribokinase family)
MPVSRQQICESASRKLSAALPTLSSVGAMVGLDGFVDEIIAVVDKRLEGNRLEPVRTISAMGEKILRAAGQSCNYELAVKQIKLGGNGPIMANALATIGLSVSYVGSVGYPEIHPVFADFAKKAAVLSIAEAGHTDALEFEDGKLMLGKYQCLCEITWDSLLARVGKDQLKKIVASASLVAMTNWTMIPSMEEIWHKLAEQIAQSPLQDRKFFVDLADPEKRTQNDVRAAMKSLTKLQEGVEVILGLNLKEAAEIAETIGLHGLASEDSAMADLAAGIRRELNLSCVVVHPRRGAAAATATETAEFAGPFVQQPKISTGAGDHFNAGFCLGRTLGFTLEESLCAGVATSGFYVRSGESPSGAKLAGFIAALPDPEK